MIFWRLVKFPAKDEENVAIKSARLNVEIFRRVPMAVTSPLLMHTVGGQSTCAGGRRWRCQGCGLPLDRLDRGQQRRSNFFQDSQSE